MKEQDSRMKNILLAQSNVYCMTALLSKTHLENGKDIINQREEEKLERPVERNFYRMF